MFVCKRERACVRLHVYVREKERILVCLRGVNRSNLGLRVTSGLTFGPQPGAVDKGCLEIFKLTSIQ